MRFPFHLIIVPWNKWVITDDYDLDCPPRSSVPDSEEKPPLTHPHTPLWIYSLGGRGRHTMEQWPQFEIIYKERLEWVLHIMHCVLTRSVMSDSATPWTVSCQAPLSMGILQARILEWVAIPYSRRSSQPRYQTQVSPMASRFSIIKGVVKKIIWSGVVKNGFRNKIRVFLLEYTFCCTTKWISYMCTCVTCLLDLPPKPHPSPAHLGDHKVPSWAPVLFSSFPLAISLMYGSVYVPISVPQFIPPTSPTMSSPLFRVCISLPALQIDS